MSAGTGIPGAARAGLLALALGACGGEQDGPDPDAPQAAPAGVLWISLDTLRADRLGCYGNPRETSPRIDALAEQGALFERAWSTTSWTLPAHLSMFTGLPVSAHGACFADYPEQSPLRGAFVSEALAAAGWATGGFYAHSFLERPFFLDKGWEHWERIGRVWRESNELRARWEAAQAAGDRPLARELRKEHSALFEKGAPEADDAVDRALAWLDRVRVEDAGRPFLLFLHVFDVHTPYRPPEPFASRFDPDYDGPLQEVDVDDPNRPVRPGMDPRDLEHVVALYDAEIAWVDSQVGRLLDAFDQRGLTEETLVILTSDHGDEFLEHGGSGHHHTLHRELLHVPLILRWPGRVPAGARLDERVSLIDLAPTVHAATNVASEMTLPGLDLLKLARGERGPGDRVILSELRKEQGVPLDWQVSLLRGDTQFIVNLPGTERASIERVDLSQGPFPQGAPVPWDSADGRWVEQELVRQRRRLTELRSRAPNRGGALEHLTELERGELAALGYGEVDLGDGAEGGLERLCLDGCVWPNR